jgi:hypothetical protein
VNRIVIHTPMNHRKALIEALKEYLREFNRKYGMETSIETPEHNYSENWFLKSLEQGSIPDMVITHATDLAVLSRDKISEIFAPFPGRFPLRRELEKQEFVDQEGTLHPFCLVPYVMICNSRLINQEQRPTKWEDLLESQWNNMIAFPDQGTPISQAVLSFLRACSPEKFKDFFPAVTFRNSVVEVLKSVAEGDFPLGIANIAFAKILGQKHVVSIWPREGAVCIPQVMAWSRKADKRLLELGDFMLSPPIQEIFARQAFIPVNSAVPLPEELGNPAFLWDGWDGYFDILRKGCEVL